MIRYPLYFVRFLWGRMGETAPATTTSRDRGLKTPSPRDAERRPLPLERVDDVPERRCRGDGVDAMPHRLDAVDAAARAPATNPER